MNLIPFPADSADYEEYCNVMNAMADEAEASTPDPEPSGWSPDEESDDLRARESDDYWSTMYEREEPDANDDSDPYGCDDQFSEYGMDGCCGDF
jgi:hypothetical protein